MCESCGFGLVGLSPIVIILQLLALNRLAMGSVPVIIAEFGDDVTIPCTFSLEHNSSRSFLVVTWQLANTAQVVHSYYYQEEQLAQQDPAYRNRTSLFVEELMLGNASLRLRAVRLEDEAQYLCSISSMLYRSSHTVSLRIAAPYSEPKLTLDLGNCPDHGLVHMASSGGYPRPAVEWFAAEGSNVTEESQTMLGTGPRGLYSINSSIPIHLGSGNNYTFVLKNPLLGQQVVRFLAIVGSCHGEAISSEHRLYPCYSLTVLVLLAISFWLFYLLIRSRCATRRNRTP
ncbi:CD276 antigen-like isoform X2 [Stegostoma tigrinum]|nr:CD276 antigen-like isoform X2 [Stegostoma tigrinum]